ncbi:MAG: hypothetical protein HY321_01005 [Armatimonadetes bacterium]|nr:hypothetical protein [Armatimonadota bacterium]
MQRRDYRTAYRSEHAGGWIVDGKPAREFDGKEDPEVLKELGREGWELVSVVGYTYFLKRPLPA